MIVYDLDLVSVALAPTKANSPLVVDADAVLAFSVACQFLQSIAGEPGEVFKRFRAMELPQLPERSALDLSVEFRLSMSVEDALGLLIPRRDNHDYS
jgi:hypothetical protein